MGPADHNIQIPEEFINQASQLPTSGSQLSVTVCGSVAQTV